jgi:hypothetical protein
VVFFGLANNGYCVGCCSDSCRLTPTPTLAIEQGRPVYQTTLQQFVIVVEGAAGRSGLPPSGSLMPGFEGRPDLQIESTKNLGNGSPDVCDTGPPPPKGTGGGIPGIPTPYFGPDPGPTPFITNALNDFACRFQVFSSSLPCTNIDDSRDEKTVSPDAEIQFCDAVSSTAAFPIDPVGTILTVKLRDSAGNTGPTAQIVVRVVTPTPPPPTPVF